MKYLTVILSVCFWGWSPRYLQAKKKQSAAQNLQRCKKKISKYKGEKKRENKPIRECEIHLDHP